MGGPAFPVGQTAFSNDSAESDVVSTIPGRGARNGGDPMRHWNGALWDQMEDEVTGDASNGRPNLLRGANQRLIADQARKNAQNK